MRTRSSYNLPVKSPPNPLTSNPKRRNRRRSKQPFILKESLVDTMVDQRTMAELLRAPSEGYAEAIVVPSILAEQFKLKHRVSPWWLEKEPSHSILTWEDLVSKFINEFFPPSRTTNLRNEISNFQQRFDESFHEAWDRYKDLLRACPHHGFTELHQLDTFYNALNPADQDSLNSAAGGNLLERRTQEQTSTVTTAMTAVLKQFQAIPPPASVKAVEEICVTCGGAHLYYQWSGSLPSNTIANPKGELKAITTRSGIVLDGPFIPIHPSFINLKEDERVEETLTDQDLAEYTIKKMLKALLSNKKKLLELANTPLNENCSAVILKKLPEKLRDPGKFLIPYGFNELKCNALANLGASVNLMPLSVWKKLESPFILGRPFLRTARALIDVHREEMILRDDDERLTLNMRHDTSSYSNQPQKESINLINVFNDSSEDFLENLFSTNHQSGNPTFPSHPKLTSPEVKNDVFDPDQVLKPLFLSPIPVEDSDSFLEKSNTSLSLPEYETFIDHTKETNSDSTTTHADYSLPKPRVHVPNVLTTHPTLILDSDFIPSDNSLPEFETFYFDIKEKNSGSTTIHADISLPDLECFKFDFKPDPSKLTSIVDFGICENILSATNANFPPEEDHSPLFAYVVWIFIFFLTYPVVPPHHFSFGNEDTIFDPGITNYHFFSLLSDVSHRCETIMKFNVYPKLLNESLMDILSSSCSPMEQ
nr:hypothetical protein [Tanacetum cinerariifolium]